MTSSPRSCDLPALDYFLEHPNLPERNPNESPAYIILRTYYTPKLYMTFGGFGTEGSALCRMGLLAENKFEYWVVCLDLFVMPFV